MTPKINLPAKEIADILRSGIQKARSKVKTSYDEQKLLPILLRSYYVPKNDPKRKKNTEEMAETLAISSTKEAPLELIKAAYILLIERCFDLMDKAGDITGQQAVQILEQTAENVSVKTASISDHLRRIVHRFVESD